MNPMKSSFKPSFRAACLMLVVIMLAALVGAALAAPGDLDTTFDSDGRANYNLITGECSLTSGDCPADIVIQNDGKIIIGGVSRNTAQSRYDFTLVRFNTDGSIDTGFGVGGVTQTSFGTTGQDSLFRTLLLQPDGKILAGGESLSDFALARFNPDGSLDTSFGGDGRVTTPIVVGTYDGGDYIMGLAVQPSNNYIVAAGFTYTTLPTPPPQESDFALVRFTDTGGLDPTFGVGGIVTTTLDIAEPSNDEAYGVALQPDGKIIAVGYHRPTASTGNEDFAIQRFLINGAPDPAFGGGDGTVITSVVPGNDQARAAAVQPDGRILVAGIANGDFALVRYLSNGDLDLSFGGGDGMVTTGAENLERAYSMTIQPDGKIVLAGSARNGPRYFGLARYNYDGTLDTTFGGNGVVTSLPALGVMSPPIGFGVEVQRQDGKLVIGGAVDGDPSPTSIDEDYGLERYLNDLEVTVSGVTNGQTVGAGSTNVSITLNSGGPCDFTVIKHPIPPGGAPADPGELPVYWTVTTTCTTYNIDLVFSYTDVELLYGNNVAEARLVAFRKFINAFQWISQGGTVNTTANTVSVANVTTLSDWALIADAPTAVTMTGFSAQSELESVRIDWQTALEIDLVGFNLYRATSLDGEWELLNKEGMLVPAGSGGLVGAAYVYLDTEVEMGTRYYYVLEAISLEGTENFGPAIGQFWTPYYLPFVRR